MKYTIREDEKDTNIIPEIGQVWRHPGDDLVYMRIDPFTSGEIKLKNIVDGIFYSINLKSGKISHTSKRDGKFDVCEKSVEFEF